MITDTNAYKGQKFTCESCGYVVSSDTESDFSVVDFQYCPYCGTYNGDDKQVLTVRDIAIKTMQHQTNYSEDTCHMFSKGVQALCIALENDKNNWRK